MDRAAAALLREKASQLREAMRTSEAVREGSAAAVASVGGRMAAVDEAVLPAQVLNYFSPSSSVDRRLSIVAGRRADERNGSLTSVSGCADRRRGRGTRARSTTTSPRASGRSRTSCASSTSCARYVRMLLLCLAWFPLVFIVVVRPARLRRRRQWRRFPSACPVLDQSNDVSS